MCSNIRLAILDDHQSIVDGYCSRLKEDAGIEVAATITYGDDLLPTLKNQQIDVLILDVSVPASQKNPNPYPILHLIPEIRRDYPALRILVISMHNQKVLINKIMEAGANGYLLKDDIQAIRCLAPIVRTIAGGSIHLSDAVYRKLAASPFPKSILSRQQINILSLFAAYPDETVNQIANRDQLSIGVVNSILYGIYNNLGVHNRVEAIAKARQLGLISPEMNILE
jgi:two-component system, NarL family, nitrate/nitrite response regulator NarL